MQILVIRHAPAEDAVFPGGSDSTRELTPKGRKLFAEFVERLVKPAFVPDLVLNSPLVRTVQTAEILAQVTNLRPDQVRIESLLAPGIPAARIVSGIESIQVNRLALVAHNPDVGLLASYLIGGGSFDFKKGSIACIEFSGPVASGVGRLVWFASPKLIVQD
ncbi:MAG: phosphohistidine phosphatase, SixA [Planctomycetaceae bacterium]|nr:phosphohistidine phosphatase, SixA [Planctomycetaceae bacterium]